jgi:hypothetical protein
MFSYHSGGKHGANFPASKLPYMEFSKILCHNICVLIQEINELGIEPNFA